MKKAIILSLPIGVVAICISLFFRIYLAHNIDTKDQTYFFTVLDFTSIMAVIFIGFRSSMTVSFARHKNPNEIINIFRLLLLSATLGSAAIFTYPIYNFVDGHISAIFIVLLFFSFGGYIYVTNKLAMFKLYKSINALTFLEPTLMAGLFFLLYASGIPPLQALLFSAILENILLVVVLKLANSDSLKEPPFLKPKIDEQTKSFIKNSALSSLEFVFGVAFIYLAIIFAKIFFGFHELSLYQIVIKPVFMYAITLLVFPVVKFAFVHISEHATNKNIAEVLAVKKWIHNYALVCGISFVLFIFTVGEDGLAFVFGNGYQDAFFALLILSFALYFAIMNTFYLSTLKAFDSFKTSTLVRLSSVGFFVASFFIWELIAHSFYNIVLGLTVSYICVNIVAQKSCDRFLKQGILCA